MDKFHKTVVKAVMELEASDNLDTAKELLIGYLEVKNAFENNYKIRYVSSARSFSE